MAGECSMFADDVSLRRPLARLQPIAVLLIKSKSRLTFNFSRLHCVQVAQCLCRFLITQVNPDGLVMTTFLRMGLKQVSIDSWCYSRALIIQPEPNATAIQRYMHTTRV